MSVLTPRVAAGASSIEEDLEAILASGDDALRHCYPCDSHKPPRGSLHPLTAECRPRLVALCGHRRYPEWIGERPDAPKCVVCVEMDRPRRNHPSTDRTHG